ncbi:hypothetical protein HU764_024155 [Pseudomonas sp. SWRI100]|uniref:type II secretion system protein GspL n=1 Tax=Pseudomonas TaxID=286 RepID=UPI0016487609|nr:MULTISPECIES: type II secretion system protein GspL [Pseudomonas]MBC3494775.1 hypothetical protein [Pseudomonas sp. SWRI67]MBV4529158.1 hypothetical protein [Pseudomonas kermanshahensis]
MSEVFLFLLAEGMAAADTSWPVIVRTAQGLEQRTQLGDLPAALPGAAVVVIVPMEMAGCCVIGPVPGKRPRRESLAYAAEEQLASPLETSHLAFGAADEQGCRRVLMVALEGFQQLLSLLQAQGIDPVAVHVDADLLGGNEACALWFEGRWLLGGGGCARLAVSADAAQLLARQLPRMAWMAETHHPGMALCNHPVPSALATLVQGRAGAIDLRQGALRRRRKGPGWHGLAAGLALIVLMASVADYLRAEWVLQRATQQQAENVMAFQRWAPDQPVGPDLAARIVALEQRTMPSTAVERLAWFAEHLVSAGNVTLERAESDPAGSWRMDVAAQGFGDLERLRERVPGLLVEHASQSEHGVRAALSWQEAE